MGLAPWRRHYDQHRMGSACNVPVVISNYSHPERNQNIPDRPAPDPLPASSYEHRIRSEFEACDEFEANSKRVM